MSLSALRLARVDLRCDVAEIPGALARLASEPAAEAETETRIAMEGKA
jgi:hypothetical protein